MDPTDLMRRAGEFAQRHGFTLGERLGSGVQGIVLSAKSQAEGGRVALKVHHREPDYCRERDAYLRLQQLGLTVLEGCNVPELIGYDDALWVIAMTVVKRPFVLDFAGAFLDRSPGFSDEVLAEWHAEKLEQFGKDWPRAQSILRALKGHGIFLVDVHPGNVSFRE